MIVLGQARDADGIIMHFCFTHAVQRVLHGHTVDAITHAPTLDFPPCRDCEDSSAGTSRLPYPKLNA